MGPFGPISEAVESSLKAADWLTPSDEGAMELARSYAQLLDEGNESGESDVRAKAHAVAGPNLQKTLASLGLTAVDGASFKAAPVKESKRDELKEKRRRAAAGA